jgi:hypothetical protein
VDSAARSQHVRALSGAARRLLLAAQEAEDLEAARGIRTASRAGDSAGDAAAEARDAVLSLILAHVGKPLRSLEFISKLSGARRGEP